VRLGDALLTKGSSLLLLTGESGVGKSWLWRQLASQLPSDWRFLPLDLCSAIDALDFHALIADGLGGSSSERLATARCTLIQTLREEAADGRSWVLVLEDAQSATPATRAELLALMHAMEAGEGFAAILLVGPTSLSRLLGTRDWRSLAERLRTHVHLLPLDLDECRELVDREDPTSPRDARGLELLHRDAAGNPRRLFRLLSDRREPIERTRVVPTILGEETADSSSAQVLGALLSASTPSERPRSNVEVTYPEAATRVFNPPAPMLSGPAELIPSRPPLRVEEGLVEVGWPGSLEAESAAASEECEESSFPSESAMSEVLPPGEEIIEDHYAALQAWNEWAQNRGRTLDGPTEMTTNVVIADSKPGRVDTEEDMEEDPARRPTPGLRAEPQHDHAPYSQLFSKLRQSS